MSDSIMEKYQKETKYIRGQMPEYEIDWDARPEIYKNYPDAEKVALISPENINAELKSATFDDILWQRKSVRKYANRPLSLEQLSYILWATDGKQRIQNDFQLRTVPSAGARYPIEMYIVANNVEGVQAGVYFYSVENHELQLISKGDFGDKAASAALDQKMCASAPLTIIWTAVFERTAWKYSERALRYIYMDAGHVGHSLALSAVALGLGSCQIAALFDDEVDELIGVDGEEESTIYMSVVGYPK